MKKIFALCFTGLVMTSGWSQDIQDALRYSVQDLNGTARFRAMGGAFGAVGGDLSAISVNPAGSVIFSNNQAGATLTNFNTTNRTNYFGTQQRENNNHFDINQAGGVLVFVDPLKKSDWNKFAVALNYENTQNLNNSVFLSGVNPNNSIDQYFLSFANGRNPSEAVPFGVLNDFFYDELFFNEQQAYLGYNSYIIDPVSNNPNNTSYFTNIAPGGNYAQSFLLNSSGYSSKLSVNGSAQYQDWLMLGINLNFHFVDYRQSTSFFEANSNPRYPTGSTVDRVRFNNDLYTYGNGFSLQLGAIFKVHKNARLGLAYQSPTWFRLNDELRQYIATSGFGLNADANNTQYNSVVVDPNVTMIFEPYRLRTADRVTASGVFLFGKRGLISADISQQFYQGNTFTPQRDFSAENATIDNQLQAATEIRLGTEYKYKQWSLRGGYRWSESPYKNHYTMGNLTTYSGGLGYNFGDTRLDVSYSHGWRNFNQQMFNRGLTDTARSRAVFDNISVTLLFEL
ncbi:MAG: OmpP1/FadL family transporter [Flavobacterium sp.]|jgi:long-subunit fatty acid transport protein|uniref:OmpP1/FadL family transporter n=1 Tax=Flavobacterium sp. TaxID=239 RepID=UPI0022CC4CD5|nr:outer membrane protein transport protein [Flavobacterium sp.]MCZ8169608.1 outer membrane protein transport protein [Flavobacterium sp.]MCZ8296449.1 outer membrane protein transport protein [Flavobacterium sp.]